MSIPYKHPANRPHHHHSPFVVVETPGMQGGRGEKGEKGEPGQDGITPDISLATKTLPEGSAVTVEKSGTLAQPLFTLGIPKGEQGEKGEKGEDGKDAEVPTVSLSFIDNLF